MLTSRLALSTFLSVVLVLPARADEPKKADPPKPLATVAHIKLSGSLDEAPTADDSILGSVTENFAAKLARIQKAKKDSSIKALYLHLDSVHIGWGKLNELTTAIKDFRAGGKKAVAFLEAGETKDYLIALACH